jgi:hypothetical protein
LSHLKILFKAGQICLIDEKGQYVEDFTTLLEAFNKIKTNINSHVNANLDTINEIYNMICGKEGEEETYQIKIPKKCDGIWIKPSFDLFGTFVEDKNPNNKGNTIINGGRKHNKKGGNCIINSNDDEDRIINNELSLITIKPIADDNPIFTNLNTNIIFVFSDVMYLNLYLNTNLNTNFYQTKIQNKRQLLLIID